MYKVVFVDDEPWIVEGLHGALDWEQMGFAVAGSASDAFEAEALIRRVHPDLAIMDIVMPEKTGLACAAELSRQGENCLYILLSGITEFDYARQGIAIGVVDYLLKPLDKEMLRSAVEKALERLRRMPPPTVPSEPGNYEQLMREILDEMNRRYGEDLRLNALAQRYGVNPNYLSVLFRKHAGTSFLEHLTKLRMQAAARALFCTDTSVTAIAGACGYGDYGSFIRTFKRFYGVTPGEYRRQTRKHSKETARPDSLT